MTTTFMHADPADLNQGTNATQGVLLDLQGNQVAMKFAGTPLAKSSSSCSSSFASDIGEAKAVCKTTWTKSLLAFTFTVTAGTMLIESIDFRLPELIVPLAAGISNKLHSPFKGGSYMPLGSQGATGNWPGTNFTPTVTVWRESAAGKAGDTAALTFFNPALVRVQAYWFSGDGVSPVGGAAQYFNSFLRYFVGLLPGQSATFSAEIRFITGGAQAHWADYRSRYLAPFMRGTLQIEEAAGCINGPVVRDDWAPAGQLPGKVDKALAIGATTYMMWAPGDGSSVQYNPYPPSLDYFQDLGKTPTAGKLAHMGVLVNHFITPLIPSDGFALDSGVDAKGQRFPLTNLWLNLQHDLNWEYFRKLGKALAVRGVDIAFWDCGGEPPAGVSGLAWLRLLALWMELGIATMTEGGPDVAVWITGLWLEDAYRGDVGNYDVIKAICPQASLCVYSGGDGWAAAARVRGLWPIQDIKAVLATGVKP